MSHDLIGRIVPSRIQQMYGNRIGYQVRYLQTDDIIFLILKAETTYSGP